MKSNRPEPWSAATYRGLGKGENLVKAVEEEWPLTQEKNEENTGKVYPKSGGNVGK